jgi:cell volume regulation protein A
MAGHDAELILVAGALLAAGIAGALLAERMRIPGLLLFLGLGMLAGSEGIIGIPFADYHFAFRLGTIALAMILFDGGLNTTFADVRRVAAPALRHRLRRGPLDPLDGGERVAEVLNRIFPA